MEPTWITAICTAVYTVITAWLIIEQRRNRIDDKFPCIVARSRLNPKRAKDIWRLQLVNIGRGPAFIEYFHTTGLSGCACNDGDNTDKIDNVIGPDVGDSDLQVTFGYGEPEYLKQSGVKIVIRYRDMAGRLFESRLIAGKLEYERP